MVLTSSSSRFLRHFEELLWDFRLSAAQVYLWFPMTAIFFFQHNDLKKKKQKTPNQKKPPKPKYPSSFWAQENVIKVCPFLITSLSHQIRMYTGKALVVPAHKSIFTAAGKRRKGETQDKTRDKSSSISNDNSPSSPLVFQVLFLKSKWKTE